MEDLVALLQGSQAQLLAGAAGLKREGLLLDCIGAGLLNFSSSSMRFS